MDTYDSTKIPLKESRSLFDEIMVDFYSGKYRSAIVSLNTLLFYDLMFKLRKIANNYNSEKIKSIVKAIETAYSNNEKYNEIENKIITLSLEKNIIDNNFNSKYQYLRDIRNKCAHPGLKNNEIYYPDKTEVIMLINFVYNELLILDPLNYYSSIDYFQDRVKTFYEKGIQANNIEFESFIKIQLNKISEKELNKLFKTFFTLTILKTDDDIKKYIKYSYSILYMTSVHMKKKNIKYDLNIIEKINVENIDRNFYKEDNYSIKLIKDEIITFDDIQEFNPQILELYKSTLYNDPSIVEKYNLLFVDFEELIKYYLESDSPNILILEEIIQKSNKDILRIYYKDLMMKYIDSVPTYNGFDKSNLCINSFLQFFDIINFEENVLLLKQMNLNDQFFNSSKAQNDQNKKAILSKMNIATWKELLEYIKNK